MPAPSTRTSRPAESGCPIPAEAGVLGFVGSWLLAAVASAIPIVLFADADSDASMPIPVLGASLVVGWITFLVGAYLTSRLHGSSNMIDDLGIKVRPIDAIGLPIGVAAQIALVPLVYVPLRAVWPDTFSEQALTETAQDLVDTAEGALLPLLIVLVVLGAPIVEEIVYRGLLQRPLLARFPAPVVLLVVAGVFALIHFRPVEFPGLFAAGLVFGVCAWKSGRLGMAIAAHVGFNLAGIALAL